MVKQQKRINVIQNARRHTSAESHACTFEDSLRCYNLGYFPWLRVHLFPLIHTLYALILQGKLCTLADLREPTTLTK